MHIVTVIDKKTGEIFHNIPRLIYKDDQNWVCIPDTQIEGIFHPGENNCFKHGEADRYILLGTNNEPIGRIAVFIDHNKKNNSEYTSGGVGFFECINNQEAANLLFNTAKHWLQQKGAEAMDGPINFGENFQYWGLLVKGFLKQGVGMNYNKSYYKELFESYGFKNYYEQYSFHKNLNVQFPDRMWKFAEYIGTRPDYYFRHLKFNDLNKYINDLECIYYETWSHYLKGYTKMDSEEIRNLILDMKPILVEELIWFAYHKDKPVGFIFGIPDINQIFKYLNGKTDLLAKLRFLWYKRKKTITRFRLVMAGVIPEFQNSGIIAGVFYHLAKTLLVVKPEYKEMELSWVGDYNTKMKKLYIQMGAEHAKTHITYRYLFDSNAEFSRFTNK